MEFIPAVVTRHLDSIHFTEGTPDVVYLSTIIVITNAAGR